MAHSYRDIVNPAMKEFRKKVKEEALDKDGYNMDTKFFASPKDLTRITEYLVKAVAEASPIELIMMGATKDTLIASILGTMQFTIAALLDPAFLEENEKKLDGEYDEEEEEEILDCSEDEEEDEEDEDLVSLFIEKLAEAVASDLKEKGEKSE